MFSVYFYCQYSLGKQNRQARNSPQNIYDDDKDGTQHRTEVGDSPMNGPRYLLVGVGGRIGGKVLLTLVQLESHIPLLSQALTFYSLGQEEENTSLMSLEEIECEWLRPVLSWICWAAEKLSAVLPSALWPLIEEVPVSALWGFTVVQQGLGSGGPDSLIQG